MKLHRDILKHSAVYGIGQILGRLASLLLLPLYTRCLSPSDYGCVAILDLTAGILAVFIGSGMATAVTRYHFDTESEEDRNRLWWTGLGYLGLASLILIGPMWLARHWLANVTLGPDVVNGATFYTLALATMACSAFGELLDAYLRVQKWSGRYVSLSLLRLLVNIALNVYFLVVLDWGIMGLLTGNLIATAANTLVLFVMFCRSRGPCELDRGVARKLLGFGTPLIATALLSMVFHEADRYFLRVYVDLEQVGIYSLAYKIGQAVNMLCLVPFAAIWGVVVYEIARSPDAKRQYAAVFEQFVAGLLLVMLAASLFAKPLLMLLTTNDYSAAADLVPVICLAYSFFSLNEHFRVPVMLARKTLSLIPVYLFAAVLNIVCNLVLIPRFHAAGAAWASVLTYAGFSLFGLMQYRKIDVYPYPFRRCGTILAGMILTWIACRTAWDVSLVAGWSASVSSWLAWTGLLFGRQAFEFLKRHVSFPRSAWGRAP
ncbi:MAG: lipopolysaccharide biosynthesis protein [Planctomycetaceae bacterium]